MIITVAATQTAKAVDEMLRMIGATIRHLTFVGGRGESVPCCTDHLRDTGN